MTSAFSTQTAQQPQLRTPSFRLTGKRALVSGGSKGIGLAAALALAEAGAEVTIIARDPEALEKAKQLLAHYSQTNTAVAMDLTDHQQVEAWLKTVPAFDILVNSAGTAKHSLFTEITLEAYQTVMNTNLAATLFLSQQVAQGMIAAQKGGSIIHISSQMGHVSGPKRALYSASKFAVEGLSKGMALELGQYNIRVNTLCPTFIQTELTANMLADETFHQWVLNKIALKRLGQLDDIMGPVVFLASDAAKLITGTSLLVDGGWTAE